MRAPQALYFPDISKGDLSMSHCPLRWFHLAVAMLIAMMWFPAAALAVDVFDFKGTITDVGIQRGPGQIGGVEYRIEGEFVYAGPLDLSTSTITLNTLFRQVLANGGLSQEFLTTIDDAQLLPLTLGSDDSSEADNAKYETDGRFRPQIRIQVQYRRGAYQFNIRLDRGLMRKRPDAALCVVDPADKRPKTVMAQAFTIDDGTNPPVDVVIKKPWECYQPDRYHMRAR
jgi:hypothetical protein